MNRILLIVVAAIILTACGNNLPPGEKAAEGTTGEKVGAKTDSTGSSNITHPGDSTSNKKSNY